MATVAKRQWTLADGTVKTAWRLDYTDQAGQRHRRQFKTRKAADAARVKIEGEIAAGTHTPDRNSMTVSAALDLWIENCQSRSETGSLEHSSLLAYRNQTRHIKGHDIAGILLSRLSAPDAQIFAEALTASLSRPMAGKVLRALRMALNYAIRRGWIKTNPATTARLVGRDRRTTKIDIPTLDEVRAIIAQANIWADRQPLKEWLAARGLKKVRARTDIPPDIGDGGMAAAIVHLGFFAGLRCSEIRGLRRSDLTLTGRHPQVMISRRADNFGKIGPVKSAASNRTIPLGAATVTALRRWLANAPPSSDHYVFPTSTGRPENYANIYNRIWRPLLTEARVTGPAISKTGEIADQPKYGLHTMRHTAASLWIAQGEPPKRIQQMMGHTTLQMTMDIYGHLWIDPAADQAAATAAENAIFGRQNGVRTP